MNDGHFVISLDFEMYWGLRDSCSFQSYQESNLGEREALPKMLLLFDKYSIKCTFATVGFLFAKNKDDLVKYIPSIQPAYKNLKLSPYNNYLNQIGEDEENDPYHYGLALITQIRKHDHEIGSHTFSHYYCLAEGQDVNSFRADMDACSKITLANQIELKSLVFPRNQYRVDYLNVCQELGITAFRGNEKSWLYTPNRKDNKLKRAFRLIDTYINLSGHHCYDHKYMASYQPYNIPSSRFLRPYSKKLALFDFLKKRRIFKSMSHAAKNGLTYHLWWHPHNFGKNIDKNMRFLECILQHYQRLKEKYNFKNVTMCDLAEELRIYGKRSS